MTWLSSLPHQIPFRAASSLVRKDEKSIEGKFLWTADDLMPPELMLVEAMAQFAGGLVFEAQGFLTGIDSCEVVRAIEPGDRLLLSGSIGEHGIAIMPIQFHEGFFVEIVRNLVNRLHA